ncbi:NAD(P)-binding protein [Ophiobolus disseminans]|uniref:D-xylose 1-dehydrogenase (NADP(+), D-xylono-1,5-lactone-forming) n=1 Tax=Ophiobolus disseminans TaxID=1469910 RepID=A0A6A6ZS06_9PLEO|nr:NAD(P)-binding protein [Ophiobolus disseminans]
MAMTVMDWLNLIGEWSEKLARRPNDVKKDGALRFGILGAAQIAPQALIIPARSHAEVIVAAVAARDKRRAHAFAKKYNIPIVHDTYDELINDPALDCIYVPLPVAMHYEWALKALQAGKHVLLEKPSVSNAEEARALFEHPVLQSPNAPVLLEARHYQFHPAWHTFLSLFDPADVEEANVRTAIAAGLFPADDIRFKYELGGGTLMDLGTYNLSALRGIFGAEPTSFVSASPQPSSNDERCDIAMEATYDFPNGGVGKLSCNLGARVKYEKGKGSWWAWLFQDWPDVVADMPPWLTVKLREMHGVEEDMAVTTQKTIVMNNFMGPHMWHRIDINTTTTYRSPNNTIIKTETSTESKKAYVWPGSQGGDTKGEDWWTTYRYMLEGFVDRVKGRKGSGAWVEGDDSIKQMAAIDETYRKAGMVVRPTNKVLSGAN